LPAFEACGKQRRWFSREGPYQEAEELARKLSVLADEFPSSRMRQLYSFVLAMSLNWDEAIRVLDG